MAPARPDSQSEERRAHRCHLPAHDDTRAARQMLFESLQDFIGVGGHGTQIAILRAGIDIDHRLHVVVAHGRRARGRG